MNNNPQDGELVKILDMIVLPGVIAVSDIYGMCTVQITNGSGVRTLYTVYAKQIPEPVAEEEPEEDTDTDTDDERDYWDEDWIGLNDE